MRFPVYSVLALASIVSAAPSLHSRQAATIVNGITCQILGEKIEDPAATLAAVQSGSIQAPTGLSTTEFSDLLRQCISGSSGGHHPHTKAAAFNDGADGRKVADADPASRGNSVAPPGSTQDNTNSAASNASTSGADGASNGSNDSANAPPAGTDAPSGSSADTPAPAPAPASAATDSAAAPADGTDGANSAGSSDSNSGGNDDDSAASKAAVNPEVNPSSSSDASSAGGDPAPSPNAEAAPPSDAPADASNAGGDNSAAAAPANNDNAAPANNDSPAPAPAPAGADNSANASNAAGSPFLAYDGSPSGPQDTGDAKRLHAHQNNSNSKAKCTGLLCVGEELLSLPGLAEEVGKGGITQGSSGCPSGDIKACLHTKRR